ncbi:phytanoyl-CoA dioxygenase family protein [Xylaria bambusicola]|uniref:phytanoyl-CoA dioxygenase family protein n=1 Tax=Xylaria bambusicola TaxID=326684 RepID=UPI0020087E73|nr:phytanoyl-CoA dioxygenase family protein [Xylaria bambusicola]KAI0505160.1 phytanoyl-CoA dioxygenase family protein [Xylaria bambusicola]
MLRRVSLDRPQELISAIEEDGGVIIAGFASQSQVDQVNQDMHEALEDRIKDEAWKQRYKGRIICGYLYGRSATAREQWILSPQLQSVVNHFLRTSNPPEVDLNSAIGRSTNAILSQAVSIATLEGAEAQPVHRDDSIWQKFHQSQEESGYCLGSDLGISLLVAGVDITRANGATMANDFVWYSRQEVETWSTEAQRLAGYVTDGILGISDDENAIYALQRGEEEKKKAGGR